MSGQLAPAVAGGEPLVRITLVPVEHFGADEEDCPNCPTRIETGYGLMDAVSAWSDCNRAIGRIYRVDEDSSASFRQPGDTITVYVPQSQMALLEKRYGDSAGHRCPACHVPYEELPEGHVLNRPTCSGSATPEPEADPEFSPAEQQRMRELRESLTWTCEGCGGTLAGGNPPRCIGCRGATLATAGNTG
jgi:hypothetical protein